jgi:D-serine deaminase-like pyridoxal phosphate-dependent protein
MIHAYDLDTPAARVDQWCLETNILRMAALAKENGVALRPHIKTHKTVEIARLQLASGAVGVTVAKIGEAEVMAAAGISDLFIAYPIVGAPKLERLCDLAE